MRYWLLIITFTLSGCISSSVQEAIDAADEHARLKWSEEWKPALIAEVKSTISETKDNIIDQMAAKLETYSSKLDKIGVDPKKFDSDNSGELELAELVPLMKEIKAKNDQSSNPMPFWEIMLAVGATYLPLTGAKEMLLKKKSA